MPIYHGRNTQLLLQEEATFRTAPTPDAFQMKFSTLEMADQVERSEDNTILATTLAQKRDEVDEGWQGTLNAILCLNDIGRWLRLLWGAPVTTGAGPYTHTWTLSFDARPTALLELGFIGPAQYRRWLGCIANGMRWSVMEGDQNLEVDLVGAVQVLPVPTAAFDATPTAYAKNRACRKGGEVYDVQGASTLGPITRATVAIAENREGIPLADGQAGYGVYDVGQMEIGGQISVLWDDTTQAIDYADAHTSRALTLISKNAAGDATLKLAVPQVEFSKPRHGVRTSRGMLYELDWRGHADASDPTIELVNGVATYV